MRTIGVLGGITWHSAAEYYRLLNSLVNERAGGDPRRPLRPRSASMSGTVDPLLHAGALGGRRAPARSGRTRRRGCRCRRVRARVQHAARRLGDRSSPTSRSRRSTSATRSPTRWRATGVSGSRCSGRRIRCCCRSCASGIAGRGVEVVTPPAELHAQIDHTIFEEFSRGVFTDETRRVLRRHDRRPRCRLGRVRVHRDRPAAEAGRRRRTGVRHGANTREALRSTTR